MSPTSSTETQTEADERADRAGDFANSVFAYTTETALIAKFDLALVTLFLVAELLANLQHYTGTTPADAIRQVDVLIVSHLAELAEEAEEAEREGTEDDGEEEKAKPALSAAPVGNRYH